MIDKIDINSLGRDEEEKELRMNDRSKAKIRITKLLMLDSYRENITKGSIILIDDTTNETVAVGMLI